MTAGGLRAIRIVHAADCHLGAPGGGASATDGFRALVDLTIEECAAALVVAGDLFDTIRVSDELLGWVADQLGRMHCPAVILPGNHDHMGPGSPYRRFDFSAACGAHVIESRDGEFVLDAAAGVAFWGRAVRDHGPAFRPLQGLPVPVDGRWNVAIAHGLVIDDPQINERGSPISRDELSPPGWDYLALGHWSTFRRVGSATMPAYYAGETVGTAAHPGGAVLVDFRPGHGVTAEWTPLCHRGSGSSSGASSDAATDAASGW